VSRRHDDGSVTLTASEVRTLESTIGWWVEACWRPGADTSAPLVTLAGSLRTMLGMPD
jgi:hypothetical protein